MEPLSPRGPCAMPSLEGAPCRLLLPAGCTLSIPILRKGHVGYEFLAAGTTSKETKALEMWGPFFSLFFLETLAYLRRRLYPNGVSCV